VRIFFGLSVAPLALVLFVALDALRDTIQGSGGADKKSAEIDGGMGERLTATLGLHATL